VLGRPSEIAVPDIDALSFGKGILVHGNFHFPGRHGALYRDRIPQGWAIVSRPDAYSHSDGPSRTFEITAIGMQYYKENEVN